MVVTPSYKKINHKYSFLMIYNHFCYHNVFMAIAVYQFLKKLHLHDNFYKNNFNHINLNYVIFFNHYLLANFNLFINYSNFFMKSPRYHHLLYLLIKMEVEKMHYSCLIEKNYFLNLCFNF